MVENYCGANPRRRTDLTLVDRVIHACLEMKMSRASPLHPPLLRPPPIISIEPTSEATGVLLCLSMIHPLREFLIERSTLKVIDSFWRSGEADNNSQRICEMATTTSKKTKQSPPKKSPSTTGTKQTNEENGNCDHVPSSRTILQELKRVAFDMVETRAEGKTC